MFMLVFLSLFLRYSITFASDNSDNLRDNLRTLRIDFNKILEDIETLAEDVIVKSQDYYKSNADDIDDYNWNDNAITTSTTPKSLHETLSSNVKKRKRITQQYYLKRPKRSTRPKKVDTIQRTIENPITNIHEREDDMSQQSNYAEESIDSILGDGNDHTSESTSHHSGRDKKEKIICTIKTQNQIDTGKQKLDDLKEEMKKLNELVSLLKDQQHFFQEYKIWERPKLKPLIYDKDMETKIETISRELPDESTKPDRNENKTDLNKLKIDLIEALKSFNRTKIREAFIKNELDKHEAQIKAIQERVNHLYNEKVGNAASNNENIDDISSRANNVEDAIVGLPKDILQEVKMTKDYNPNIYETKTPINNNQYVPLNYFLNKLKHNQYIPKEKLPHLTNMDTQKLMPVIQSRGKSANINLNDASPSKSIHSVPRDTTSDNLKLKLKLLETLTNIDDHETENIKKEKEMRALKKLVLANTADASSENEMLLNLLEEKTGKNKKPKMDISKLVKLLNEAESRTDEDEIEKELKQLQHAINHLRPKDEFHVDKLEDLDSKNIGEDTSKFQAILNQLLNKKTTAINQKPAPSVEALNTHSFTPEQLLLLQELINNPNTVPPGIHPYTATRPYTDFTQDAYHQLLPYNFKYPNSYWPQSWSDLNTNYKFNPNFLSGPNIYPSPPTYSPNDYNYPHFGYVNFLKSRPFDINGNPNYKNFYNYLPGNDYNPLPNNMNHNKYLEVVNPWKIDVNNGMGQHSQPDEENDGNTGKMYEFFPGPKPNYGNTDQGSETGPKSYIAPSLDESYNHGKTNEYNDQVMSDLSEQIQNLEAVIQNLNKPYQMETQNDKNAIWNLEQKISNLKGIINSLKSPSSYGSPVYPELSRNIYLEKENSRFKDVPADITKPNEIKQNRYYNNQPLYGLSPTYQNLNSNIYALTSQLDTKKNQYSISPTMYQSSSPSEINQQNNNNIPSFLPDGASSKGSLPPIKKTIEAKTGRKKRNIDYTEQFPKFLNREYQPQLNFNISKIESEKQNEFDTDISQVVDLFKKYVMDDIGEQEYFSNGISRSNTYNILQQKLNQLKAQLELQKRGNNHLSQHFDISGRTFSKQPDVLDKIVLKIIEKVIGITPSIMNRLFGNLISDIGNSYGDYNSPLQKIISNIGVSGYFPIIIIKVLETTGTVIQYMKKNRFITQIGLPGLSLALVAGVVLFLIYFYQDDNPHNLITYLDQNGYSNNQYKLQDSYNNKWYPERQRKHTEVDISNSIPYSGYYDYFPVDNLLKKVDT